MMQRFYIRTGKISWLLILSIASVFGGLGLFEVYAKFQFGDPNDDLKYETNTYISSTYFDYVTGAPHVFGPNTHKGPIRSESIQYEDGYDYEINKFGFFTEIPLDEYPDKEADEFRIVLIGGSGAQGWGARTVEQMLHRQLEKKLNARLAMRDIRVRVINLAIAGSHIITNAQTLDGYAKHLDPDMVLAYFGANDISAMMQIRQLNYPRPTGVVRNPNGLPKGLSALAAAFPTTMVKLGVAEDIKNWLGIFSNERGMPTFDPYTRLGWKDMPPNVFYTDQIVPETEKAFKNIKRNFCGLPMVLVRQMWSPPDKTSKFLDGHYNLTLPDDALSYKAWWDRLSEDLPGYVNDEWYFLDAHGVIWDQIRRTASVNIDITFTPGPATWRNEPFTFTWTDGKPYVINNISFGPHLDNTGHFILADWLAPQLAEVVEKNFARSRTDLCEVNFR